MDEKYVLLKQGLGEFRIKLDEPLAYHTFLKIPAKARFFYIATSQNELIDALNCSRQLKLPSTVLGAGTKFFEHGEITQGLVIKNRTSSIKISGIKGKVGRGGIGVEEALVEVDSGVSIRKLNEFLSIQRLQPLRSDSPSPSTLGGGIWVDAVLQSLVQKIKVWDREEVFEIGFDDLKSRKSVILSLILKIKAL